MSHIYIQTLNYHALFDLTDPFQCYKDKILLLIDGGYLLFSLLQQMNFRQRIQPKFHYCVIYLFLKKTALILDPLRSL